MKKLLFFLFLILTLSKLEAQKLYIWCPEQINPSQRKEQLKNVEINIIINDTRILTENTKNKCTSEELCNSIFQLLKTTYPSSVFTKVNSFDKNISDNKIYIEISINAYYATFETSTWTAKTKYLVKITDFRKNSKQEYSINIEKESSSMNLFGNATAKKNLNKSYLEANIDLLNFISEKLNIIQ